MEYDWNHHQWHLLNIRVDVVTFARYRGLLNATCYICSLPKKVMSTQLKVLHSRGAASINNYL